jgi:methylisocitrate lyase
MNAVCAKLRELLDRDQVLVAPGAFNALTAKVVEKQGFECVYAPGAGIANTQLGLPDVGLLTMTEMVGQVRYICNATRLPVIADMDTGYGNAINLYRTIREFIQAGVAGVQIEDQVTPKRCGHFGGKEVVSSKEMVNKIQAAVDARGDSGLVIVARTDARSILGLDEAISRAKAYVEAGADVIFIEAPESVDEMQKITSEITSVPLLANMVEHGKTPLLSNDELEKLGFRIVIYPNSTMRSAVKASEKVLNHLYQRGTTNDIKDEIMITMKERADITGLDSVKEMEKKYLDKVYEDPINT